VLVEELEQIIAQKTKMEEVIKKQKEELHKKDETIQKIREEVEAVGQK
jgi:hypothetical protein